MLLHVLLKRLTFFWYQEGDWREVEKLWESAAHSVVNHAKLFLSTKILEAWIAIVVDLLFHHRLNVFVDQAESKPVEFAANANLCEALLLNDQLESFNFVATI